MFLWGRRVSQGRVKATPSACSYAVQYRLGGRGTPSKRLTLGKHGVLTPDEAGASWQGKNSARWRRNVDVAQVKKDEKAKLTGLDVQGCGRKRFLSSRTESGRGIGRRSAAASCPATQSRCHRNRWLDHHGGRSLRQPLTRFMGLITKRRLRVTCSRTPSLLRLGA